MSNPTQWFPKKRRFHSVTLCGPLIDDEKNLYVTSVHAVYKLTPDGQTIWTYTPPVDYPSPLVDCPSLSTGSELFGASISGHIFSLDIETGRPNWVVQHGLGSGDTAYVENHDGVVLLEYDPGNTRVVALKAKSGELLWNFAPDTPMWNFMAIFDHKDTVFFQDQDARVYRLGLHNGTLLWKNGGNHWNGKTWTDGGAMLGPNGIIYAASSKSMIVNHHPTGGGGVHAYRADNGSLVWQRHLQRPMFTWPAIGKLPGLKGYSVIVGIGANAFFPWQQVLLERTTETLTSVPFLVLSLAFVAMQVKFGRCSAAGATGFMARFSCWAVMTFFLPVLVTYRYTVGKNGMPMKTFEAEVFAFDAETGEQQWVYHLPSWPYVSAAGDGTGFFERKIYVPTRAACMPASFSAPTIDARGTVWIGYMSGMVLGIRDENNDGVVTEDEVKGFDTGAAMLHSGPAFAPGMMALTTCDSMWVWKT